MYLECSNSEVLQGLNYRVPLDGEGSGCFKISNRPVGLVVMGTSTFKPML